MFRNFGGRHEGFGGRWEKGFRKIFGRGKTKMEFNQSDFVVRGNSWVLEHDARRRQGGRFRTERTPPRDSTRRFTSRRFASRRPAPFPQSPSRDRRHTRRHNSPDVRRRPHGRRRRDRFPSQSPRPDDRTAGTPHPGYRFVRKLGRGGMSEAVHLIKNQGGKLFVEKRVSIRKGHIRERTKAELAALKQIGSTHPNLNYMVEYLWLDELGYCSFVLGHCDRGSLDKLLTSTRQSGLGVREKVIWQVLTQVANALAFMHWGIRDANDPSEKRHSSWNPLSHLDLKPQNIFVKRGGSDSELGTVVLGDFGCCVSLSDIERGRADPRRQECGTPAWYPPEGLEKIVGRGRTSYGPTTDIFMLGATIHALCRLIDHPDQEALFRPIPARFANGPRPYSQYVTAWIGRCTNPDSRARPTAEQIVRRIGRDRDIRRYAEW